MAVGAAVAGSWIARHVLAERDASAAEPQWTKSLALLALHRLQSSAEVQRQLTHDLLTIKVRGTSANKIIDQDGSLRGWAWVDDTFSWVEPTSYALIALKATAQPRIPRMVDAERLLLNRACTDGGWNYGNRKVRNEELPSMSTPTALAALALQDVPKAAPQLARALDWLDKETQSRPSAMSLALAVLSFDVAARPAAQLADALLRRQQIDGSWRGQVHLTALSVLALQSIAGGKNVFRIQ
jgi:hypothetical protein